MQMLLVVELYDVNWFMLFIDYVFWTSTMFLVDFVKQWLYGFFIYFEWHQGSNAEYR